VAVGSEATMLVGSGVGVVVGVAGVAGAAGAWVVEVGASVAVAVGRRPAMVADGVAVTGEPSVGLCVLVATAVGTADVGALVVVGFGSVGVGGLTVAVAFDTVDVGWATVAVGFATVAVGLATVAVGGAAVGTGDGAARLLLPDDENSARTRAKAIALLRRLSVTIRRMLPRSRHFRRMPAAGRTGSRRRWSPVDGSSAECRAHDRTTGQETSTSPGHRVDADV
jgi:hypothetical protein